MASESQIDNAPSTSTSLIRQVTLGEQKAWVRFVKIYSAVIYSRCRKSQLSPEDSADVLQEVFRRVHEGVGDVDWKSEGMGFRRWLRTVARNVIIDFFRSQTAHRKAIDAASLVRRLQELSSTYEDHEQSQDSNEDGLNADSVPTIQSTTVPTAATNNLRQVLDAIKIDYELTTWQAFWRTAVDGQRPVDVAVELTITAHAVRQARYKIVRRLRTELKGLIPPREV